MQVPPKKPRSITATLRPAAAKRRASEGPAWPVPITMASNSDMALIPYCRSPDRMGVPVSVQFRSRSTNIPFSLAWGSDNIRVTFEREDLMRGWLAAGVAALSLAFVSGAQAQKPELAKVRLAVGGKSSLYYLPLTVTERLGYFKEAGLDVEISDFAGGAKSLQALIGGSADVVTGSFDHTIQMQAKNQQIVAVVQMGRFPGFALALRRDRAGSHRGPKAPKGMKIGVPAPGPRTHSRMLSRSEEQTS